MILPISKKRISCNSKQRFRSNLIEKSPKIIRDLKETFKKDTVPTEKSFEE